MVYSTLSTSLQNVLLMNYEQLGKFILLLMMFLGASFYNFYWKPYKQKDTIFLSIGILRLFWNPLSLVLLYSSPLFIFFLSPEYSFYTLFTLIIVLVTVFISVFGVFVGLDVFKVGLLGVVSKMGVNVDPATARYFNKLTNGGKSFK